MKFFKILLIPLCVGIVSMFYFPFEFRVLPGLNTKKMLAAMALGILFFRMVEGRKLTVSKDFILLSIIAGLVSFAGIASVTINNTTDYTYATYITSFWVWWAAAFSICQIIKWVHGHIDWTHIINYLIAVCVFQCIITLIMDSNKAVKSAINSIILQQDLVLWGNVRRLYGIGAALDVAGMRFAAVLVMIVFLLIHSDKGRSWYEYLLYSSAFIIITVAGNMIARTTLVGVIIALSYLLLISVKQKFFQGEDATSTSTIWRWISVLVIISIPLITVLYQTDKRMHDNIRFAFEGFFNYVEKGKFNYSSNNRLREMYVWPDNAKTWIIGDGYFENPLDTDIHYTGEIVGGYYKSTDVGYSRLIFYFGILGLSFFSLLIARVALVCTRKLPNQSMLFALVLLLHFVIWAKVASDLFLVFALFLCLGNENLNENEDLSESTNEEDDVPLLSRA